MMRPLTFATLGFLLLAGASRLGAQAVPSPYRYVEPAQSIHFFGGYVLTESGAYGLTPHSAPRIGARYEGRFTGPVSGIVELSALPSRRDVYGRTNPTDLAAPLDRLGETRDLVVSAQAGFRFSLTGPRTWHDLQPFLALTAGAVRDFSSRGLEKERQLPSAQLVSAGPAFAVAPAAGLEWFLSERLSLRIAATDHLWRRAVPEGLSRTGTRRTEWTNNPGFSSGFGLHF